MIVPQKLTADLLLVPSHHPVPGAGFLPVHSYLLRAPVPVLVDTGAAIDAAAYLEALDTVIDPRDLRFVLLTHEDADHAGALEAVLARAPRAKLLTTATGFGKLSAALALDPARVELVRPGARLDLLGLRVDVHRPPHYDSPATLAYHLPAQRLLFSSDALGAFVPEPVERGEELDLDELGAGLSQFCRANSPWLAHFDVRAHDQALAQLGALAVDLLLASHLPPVGPERFRALLERARRLPREGEAPLPLQTQLARALVEVAA